MVLSVRPKVREIVHLSPVVQTSNEIEADKYSEDSNDGFSNY